MPSHVSTKRGDKGRTVTIGGTDLSKSDVILECCGHLDSLRAQTALCRQLLLESGRKDAQELSETLLWVLHLYFLIGTECNDPTVIRPEYRKGQVAAKHLKFLESEQEKLEAGLELPKSFIVSASNPLAAQVDIACTSTRALERNVVRLKEAVPEFSAQHIIVFVNRLSDYFFILARHLEDGAHLPVDYSRLDASD